MTIQGFCQSSCGKHKFPLLRIKHLISAVVETHFTATPNMHNSDTEVRHNYYSKNVKTLNLYIESKAEISDIKHKASLMRSVCRNYRNSVTESKIDF